MEGLVRGQPLLERYICGGLPEALVQGMVERSKPFFQLLFGLLEGYHVLALLHLYHLEEFVGGSH